MNQDIRKILAKNIEQLREKKGSSRESMSVFLGFDNSYISKLEKEKVNITLDRLTKIADFFDTDVYKLLK